MLDFVLSSFKGDCKLWYKKLQMEIKYHGFKSLIKT